MAASHNLAVFRMHTFCVHTSNYQQLSVLLQQQGKREKRYIAQFHYTDWADGQAPQSIASVLDYLQDINKWSMSPDKGPIIVHGSEGTGRTGTLIVLDNQLSELRDTGSVNVAQNIWKLRHQRGQLVQSTNQYEFIYNALSLAIFRSFLWVRF